MEGFPSTISKPRDLDSVSLDHISMDVVFSRSRTFMLLSLIHCLSSEKLCPFTKCLFGVVVIIRAFISECLFLVFSTHSGATARFLIEVIVARSRSFRSLMVKMLPFPSYFIVLIGTGRRLLCNLAEVSSLQLCSFSMGITCFMLQMRVVVTLAFMGSSFLSVPCSHGCSST